MLVDILKKIFNGYSLETCYEDSFCFINVERSLVRNILIFLRKHSLCRFNSLYDVSAFINDDKINSNKNKYSVYYYLFSLRYNTRILVTSQIPSEKIVIKTVSDIFSNAAWLEREVWEMFGVFFKANKDLRRLLTDYGFKYNPLLKEYPLKGYVELKFDTNSSILKYNKVIDQQQPKIYDFKNPWKFFY